MLTSQTFIGISAGPSICVDGVSRVAGTVEATVSVDTHFSTVIQVHGTLINVIAVVAICVECCAAVA